MEDTQRESRVDDDTRGERPVEGFTAEEPSAAPLARLLANPRRVRRA